MNKKNFVIVISFMAITFCILYMFLFFEKKEKHESLEKLKVAKETLLKEKEKFLIPDENYFVVINYCLLNNNERKILFATYRDVQLRKIFQMKVFDMVSGELFDFPEKKNNIYNFKGVYVYHSYIDNKTYVEDGDEIIEINNSFGIPVKHYPIEQILTTFMMENNQVFGFSLSSKGIIYHKQFNKVDDKGQLCKIDKVPVNKLTEKQVLEKTKELEDRIKNTNLLKTMMETLKAVSKTSYAAYFNDKVWFVRKSDCLVSCFEDNKLKPVYSLNESLNETISLIDIKSNNDKMLLLVNNAYQSYYIIEINKNKTINLYPLDRTGLKNSVAVGLVYVDNLGFLVLNYDQDKESYFLIEYGE